MPLILRLWNAARKLDAATLGAVVEIVTELVSRREDRYSRARRIAEELAHERATEELLSRAGRL